MQPGPSKEGVEENGVVVRRVPQHRIRIECPTTHVSEEETDLSLLTNVVSEAGHTRIQNGTKRALLGGGGRFNGGMTQQRLDPHLTLSGNSFVLFAQADPWERLKDTQLQNEQIIAYGQFFEVLGF